MYFVVLAHLHCPSGASLHYAVCHTTCILLQPSFGQLLVSCPPPSSFRPSFRYHFTSFVAYPFASFHGFPPANTQKPAHSGKHIPFRKASPTILTGFHYRSTTSFIPSVSFSPPAANNFCVPCLPAPATCLSWFFDQQHKGLTKIKNTRQTLAST